MNRLSDFDFALDESLIAHAPAAVRSESRLMVLDRQAQTIEHHRFSDLLKFYGPEDLIVANNTRVIRARLLGERETGGKIEFLMLEEKAPCLWEGILQSSARQKAGLEFRVRCDDGQWLNARLTRGSAESSTGTVEVRFDRDPLKAGVGELPLPPYIAREGKRSSAEDSERYQTVYAKNEGSAAAPTAGLHFTPQIIESLKKGGTAWAEVTLHVGLGTFRPVKVDDLSQHQMHEERYSISESAAAEIMGAKNEKKRRVTGVGTTVVRTLESAATLDADGRVVIRPGASRTQLFLRPGHAQFRVVDRMLTNFHLPRSTLLMLVSAFAGRDFILRAYEEATREKYRFFSYGDAMLIK